ncbi:MAG: DUF4474 domain-containing protein [Clostridiales bacterium]|nr:DUF4474 domain-containing protein [Clostridiales bacterium]
MKLKLTLLKKGLAIILAVFSVLKISPFGIEQVAAWVVGPDYYKASLEERAELILDAYINRGFISLGDDAEDFARSVITEFLIQIFGSAGDSDKVIECLDSLPVYKESEINFERGSYDKDPEDIMKIKQSLLKLIASTKFSDDVKNALSAVLKGCYDVRIYFIYTNNPDVYEFCGDAMNDNDEVMFSKTHVYYNHKTHIVSGWKNKGIFEIGFDCDTDQFGMTNPVNAWHRQYGYNISYDVLGNILLIDTNTVRVFFDYDGKHKMFQFWKGNYTKISNGAEIGLYNRKDKSVLRYDSVPDEEMLVMQMELYHKGELFYKTDPTRHWWLTGYVPGDLMKKKDILFKASIEFPNEEMLKAFYDAAVKAFGKRGTVTTEDLTAYIVWQ